jgi:hypothetical protein
MGEREIFGEINLMLKNKGYDLKIQSMSELKSFLSDEKNLDKPVYEDIMEYYDMIRMGIGMW